MACFPLNLSMGDISAPFSEERAEYLQSTVMVGGPNFSRIGEELMETARRSLERVRAAREPVRIWTSRTPDEFCGFCHILTELPKDADIRVVELPEYEVFGKEIRTYSGWGELGPYELGRFQRLERPLSTTERRYFSMLWRTMQQENSPLRAMVNGQLLSVGADFYDGIILREVEKQPREFHEGRLIGEILGRYQLGLGDSIIALRIEEFISRGMLTPATEAEPDRPIYHRFLRKD